MSQTLKVGLLQAAFGPDMAANIDTVKTLIREAAGKGAQVILPPELFQGEYFCKTQIAAHFDRAYPAFEHPCVTALQPLAEELEVAIPVSIYEKDGPEYYNSVVMLDADGSVLGVYRKSHIPDGPGYQEKFYFKPGDTGFRVWHTRYGRIGVGICWDQWFPECARSMALMGAEVLMYPTAIGSEPQDSGLDTAARWRRCMQGHGVANVIPVVAANRVGNEDGQVFYGTSFISDHTGEVVCDLDREETGVLVAEFDRQAIDRARASWGVFRDRRPDLYDTLV
ncbi:N-carbamoylputrescine amidase [Woodsholea maritima]|uniref:N-carbamoylputrescine amidase n=1 Tax=Woodsholea maritima TaxID=240237 RepID=UPI000373D264|nr:N-carbamoylputrescine amidase [Woodsholea maritima]